jgi:acyl carrier protein
MCSQRSGNSHEATEIHPEDNLELDSLDSLSKIELVVSLEKTFSLSLLKISWQTSTRPASLSKRSGFFFGPTGRAA